MTALATIGALTPMALGITGGRAFISQPLAIVVIGGPISSTLLTTSGPVLYTMTEAARAQARVGRPAERRARRGPGRSGTVGAGRSEGGRTGGLSGRCPTAVTLWGRRMTAAAPLFRPPLCKACRVRACRGKPCHQPRAAHPFAAAVLLPRPHPRPGALVSSPWEVFAVLSQTTSNQTVRLARRRGSTPTWQRGLPRDQAAAVLAHVIGVSVLRTGLRTAQVSDFRSSPAFSGVDYLEFSARDRGTVAYRVRGDLARQQRDREARDSRRAGVPRTGGRV